MSAMVLRSLSLRTKKPVCSVCATERMRTSACFASLIAIAVSGALAMPMIDSPRFTIGMITLSPAVGCTSMLMPAFSLSTFATAEAVVWLRLPGGSVAKPTACASAPVETKAAPRASRFLKCMNPSSKRGRESTVLYCGDAAEGPHSLLRDRRPAGAQAAGRCARRGVDDRQRRRVVHRAQHAAHRSSAALWTAAAAGSAELGVARVRHAGRVLALPRRLEKAWTESDAGDQRLGDQVLSACRAGGEGCGMGVHGARLDPAADASCRGSARGHSRDGGRDQGVHRQAAAGLGKSRPDGNQ